MFIVNTLESLHDFQHVNCYDATERDNMLNCSCVYYNNVKNSY